MCKCFYNFISEERGCSIIGLLELEVILHFPVKAAPGSMESFPIEISPFIIALL